MWFVGDLDLQVIMKRLTDGSEMWLVLKGDMEMVLVAIQDWGLCEFRVVCTGVGLRIVVEREV